MVHADLYVQFYVLTPTIVFIFFFSLLCIISFLKFNEKYYWVQNFYKDKLIYSVYIIIVLIFVFILLRLYLHTYVMFEALPIAVAENYSHKLLLYYLDFFLYGQYVNVVGWGLLLLCSITTVLALFYLGDKDFLNKGSSSLYFLFFLFCTFIMVNTSNLLVMFLSFEFIFFPSLYFVYILGYVKKVDKTIFFLLVWTLLGSFLVFFSFAYIYIQFGTLDFKLLLFKKFTEFELNVLYFIFFIGFGVKLPIFPFHYWLTKVHVEAPAGFSMFLSGFLVKTALYCFFYINILFSASYLKNFFIIWICFCIVEASIKMWVQVDIKKLIAFATIQEMNMLLVILLLSSNINLNFITLFIVMHGLLSTFMFFLVDQLQKRAQTRNILSLGGFGSKYELFQIHVWIMLLFFLGFPFTVKFFIEWNIGLLLMSTLGYFGCFVFFCGVFFGGLGFIKCWLFILYGNPSVHLRKLKTVDFFPKDRLFAYILIFLLCILNLFIHFV